jgi:hypothetical protein
VGTPYMLHCFACAWRRPEGNRVAACRSGIKASSAPSKRGGSIDHQHHGQSNQYTEQFRKATPHRQAVTACGQSEREAEGNACD